MKRDTVEADDWLLSSDVTKTLSAIVVYISINPGPRRRYMYPSVNIKGSLLVYPPPFFISRFMYRCRVPTSLPHLYRQLGDRVLCQEAFPAMS